MAKGHSCERETTPLFRPPSLQIAMSKDSRSTVYNGQDERLTLLTQKPELFWSADTACPAAPGLANHEIHCNYSNN